MKKWHKHATGFQHWLRAWCVKWRWRWCMIKFISVRKCLVPIWLRHQNRLPFLVWSLIERRVWEITYVMSQKVVSSNSTTCWKSGSVLQMKLQRLWCIQWSRRNFITATQFFTDSLIVHWRVYLPSRRQLLDL